MSASDRRRALGAEGERLARRHLEARGLVVLDANFRTRHGELDIVAADDRCLVFCEVKTRIGRADRAERGERGGFGASHELGPFAAVGHGKRRKLRLLAREWLADRGADVPWRPELRFDVVGIELDPCGCLLRLDHLEGAF